MTESNIAQTLWQEISHPTSLWEKTKKDNAISWDIWCQLQKSNHFLEPATRVIRNHSVFSLQIHRFMFLLGNKGDKNRKKNVHLLMSKEGKWKYRIWTVSGKRKNGEAFTVPLETVWAHASYFRHGFWRWFALCCELGRSLQFWFLKSTTALQKLPQFETIVLQLFFINRLVGYIMRLENKTGPFWVIGFACWYKGLSANQNNFHTPLNYLRIVNTSQ